MYSRRSLLKTTALFPVAAVAGCATAGQWLDPTLAQVVADVKTVAAGVQAILPNVASLAGISQDVVNTVTGIINDVVGVASQVAGAATEAAAKPLVQKLASYISALAAAVGAIPGLPPMVQMVIAAAEVLVPAIAQVLGIVGVQAAKPTMTVDQARGYLQIVARATGH